MAAGATVLCVADGEGRNSVWLAARGLQVDAFDISEVGVAKARVFAAEQGVDVNYSVAGCDGFDWPQSACDGVAAIFIQFADPALRERMFQRMAASLKPGGTLVLQGYGAKQLECRTGGAGHRLAPVHAAAAARGARRSGDRAAARVRSRTGRGSRPPGPIALVGLVARRT
ncbi:MAG: Methyltransferase type 11 [Ramlibacter sp.]|jgi:SAM-dependent methyltransferase|uniref:SAM-dependent methyltransferase n=1 Tax=Ramlibacter sp. TaxID=1917967 RepID=UPI002603482E|nr:class I SAM-dependent methyltransferase [Ramlibacter sp.]MDB5751544.1 Methyltransferase type 11 [Ramlibacter sp.]